MSNKDFKPMDKLDWCVLVVFVLLVIGLFLWNDPIVKEYTPIQVKTTKENR